MGCADDGSGHVPHECGSQLEDGGSNEMGEEWWHGGKGDDGKRKKKKKGKLTKVSAAAELTQQLLFNRV